MTRQSSAPPKGALIAIKLARAGMFKDEYEDYFLQEYDDKLKKHGETYARRWAYRYAAKAMFFTAWEWTKLILTIYVRLAGR